MYDRLYLAVARASYNTDESQSAWSLAVVGLETNGGYGKSCYAVDSRPFIKDIKQCTAGLDRDPDGNFLYVVAKYGYPLKLKANTVADMTTVLVVGSPDNKLSCRMVGSLTRESIDKVDGFYQDLRSRTDPLAYIGLMTNRTPKASTAAVNSKGKPPPQWDHTVIASILDPILDSCLGFGPIYKTEERAKEFPEELPKDMRYVGRPGVGWKWEPKKQMP